MIEVTTDYEGVRIALRELLEEFFQSDRSEMSMVLAHAANQDAAFASTADRTLSPGYYDWAQYLFYLDRFRAAGVQFGFHDASEEELIGLGMVNEERMRWSESHPQCPKCAARNESLAFACRKCSEPLKRSA